MLSNFFLLDFNESLESYIFDLIQSIKINKINLFIKNMIIVLVDHDKRSNDEKSFSFKSMIAQFDDKKSNSRTFERVQISNVFIASNWITGKRIADIYILSFVQKNESLVRKRRNWSLTSKSE